MNNTYHINNSDWAMQNIYVFLLYPAEVHNYTYLEEFSVY